MKRIIVIGFLCVCFGIKTSFSQQLHDYGFVKDISIPVLRNDSVPFACPWAGGMNNMQFGWMDCNRNGIKDLIAFDVHGNRVLPFLRKSDNSFEYAPQYAHLFPKITGFMQLIDFDKDGKEDIFTYHEAGIMVYRNVSDTGLKFELFTEQILSLHGSGQAPLNLFCTEGDYVVIQDLDGDGDVDILAFSVLGKYVYYHKNMSVERYGNCNHLEFELADECWGKFAENEEGNAITLNENCGQKSSKTHRHTGSTMLVFDENGNGKFDLLLGDMGYPNVFLLTNGGTTDSAHITAKDSLFPSYDVPIRLYSMPCPVLMDIDNDGMSDLLVSPLDLTMTKSENKESVWLYKNIGTQQYPSFSLQTKSFLQDEMIDFGSGAYPVLYDMNGDGLLDLIVGNYGYYDSTTSDGYDITCHYSAALAYFKNIGTASNPVFLSVTDDLAGLRKLGYISLIPSVGDINGDGKPDIILGTSNKGLIYLENNSTSADTLAFLSPVMNYQSLSVPEYAAVQLFDLDNDGLLDLIVGARRGIISYYKNEGTATNPNFILQTDTLGKINVRDFYYSSFGYATPCLFRTKSGETRLFTASESGKISYYKNIDHNLDGTFTLDVNELFFMDNNLAFSIKEGKRTAIAAADMNNDGYLDMIVGNYAGGIAFYSGITPPDRSVTKADDIAVSEASLQIFPNPANDLLYFSVSSSVRVKSVHIYDILGRCFLQKTFNDAFFGEIDVSSLSKGVYVVKFATEDGRFCVKKLVKFPFETP